MGTVAGNASVTRKNTEDAIAKRATRSAAVPLRRPSATSTAPSAAATKRSAYSIDADPSTTR
jgi:hypothetical protein